MAKQDIQVLRDQSTVIRDEFMEEANTAVRVGSNFLDIVDTFDFYFNDPVEGVFPNLTTAKGDIVVIKSDLTGIKSDLSTAKGDIVVIKYDLTGIKSDLSDLANDLENIDLSGFIPRTGTLPGEELSGNFELGAGAVSFLRGDSSLSFRSSGSITMGIGGSAYPYSSDFTVDKNWTRMRYSDSTSIVYLVVNKDGAFITDSVNVTPNDRKIAIISDLDDIKSDLSDLENDLANIDLSGFIPRTGTLPGEELSGNFELAENETKFFRGKSNLTFFRSGAINFGNNDEYIASGFTVTDEWARMRYKDLTSSNYIVLNKYGAYVTDSSANTPNDRKIAIISDLEGFIPLTGTKTLKPITGNIEFTSGKKIYSSGYLAFDANELNLQGNQIGIYPNNGNSYIGVYPESIEVYGEESLLFSSSEDLFFTAWNGDIKLNTHYGGMALYNGEEIATKIDVSEIDYIPRTGTVKPVIGDVEFGANRRIFSNGAFGIYSTDLDFTGANTIKLKSTSGYGAIELDSPYNFALKRNGVSFLSIENAGSSGNWTPHVHLKASGGNLYLESNNDIYLATPSNRKAYYNGYEIATIDDLEGYIPTSWGTSGNPIDRNLVVGNYFNIYSPYGSELHFAPDSISLFRDGEYGITYITADESGANITFTSTGQEYNAINVGIDGINFEGDSLNMGSSNINALSDIKFDNHFGISSKSGASRLYFNGNNLDVASPYVNLSINENINVSAGNNMAMQCRFLQVETIDGMSIISNNGTAGLYSLGAGKDVELYSETGKAYIVGGMSSIVVNDDGAYLLSDNENISFDRKIATIGDLSNMTAPVWPDSNEKLYSFEYDGEYTDAFRMYDRFGTQFFSVYHEPQSQFPYPVITTNTIGITHSVQETYNIQSEIGDNFSIGGGIYYNYGMFTINDYELLIGNGIIHADMSYPGNEYFSIYFLNTGVIGASRNEVNIGNMNGYSFINKYYDLTDDFQQKFDVFNAEIRHIHGSEYGGLQLMPDGGGTAYYGAIDPSNEIATKGDIMRAIAELTN